MVSNNRIDDARAAIFGPPAEASRHLKEWSTTADEGLVADLTDASQWSARHPPTRVAQAVASNPHCPPPVLSRLACHPDAVVRAHVAQHPSTPAALVDSMRQDPLSTVRAAAEDAYGAALWRDAPQDIRDHPSRGTLRGWADRWEGSPEEFFVAARGTIML